MSPKKAPKVKRYTNAGRARKRQLIIAALVATIVIVAAVTYILLSQPGLLNNVNPSPSASTSPSESPTPVPSLTPTPYYDSSAAPLTSPVGEYSATGTRVLFITSMGNITIQLRDDKPITTTNFVNLINQGIYDDTVFHRVIAGFMIQGGQNQSANTASINDEIGNDNHNYPGTIAMAKTSQPNSATSEFFINVGNNNQITYQDGTSFDGTYTVFGQVIGGMDVVTSISNVQVQPNPLMGNENSQPVSAVTLIKAVVLS